MRDLMFEIPTSADVTGHLVNSATVRGGHLPDPASDRGRGGLIGDPFHSGA